MSFVTDRVISEAMAYTRPADFKHGEVHIGMQLVSVLFSLEGTQAVSSQSHHVPGHLRTDSWVVLGREPAKGRVKHLGTVRPIKLLNTTWYLFELERTPAIRAGKSGRQTPSQYDTRL